MGQEQQIATLINETSDLTQEVASKMGQIDQRVAAEIASLEQWKTDNQPDQRIVYDIKIGGSTDFLYPVWWQCPEGGELGSTRVNVLRRFAWNGDVGERPLDPARPHQAGLLLEMEMAGFAWGGDPCFLEIKRFAETYNNTVSHVNLLMYSRQYRIDPAREVYNGAADGTTNGCFALSGLYLRGGGLTYRIVTNQPFRLFGYHDGTGQNLREIYTAVNDVNAYWVVEPIPFADRIAPPQSATAFVHPAA